MWTELKMRIGKVSFEIGSEINIISETESAPAEIFFVYNEEQHVVEWTNENESFSCSLLYHNQRCLLYCIDYYLNCYYFLTLKLVSCSHCDTLS